MQCPSCDLPLQSESVSGEVLERCAQCGGEYSTNETLRRLLDAHAAPSGTHAEPYERPSPLSEPVRYRKCPACGEMMLRKNFLETSGVIVDVCSAHGVWFDRGELTQIFAFAATGELARAEQDLVKRIESRKRIDAFERDFSTVFFWSMRA